MHKILLADDELLERKALKIIIDENMNNASVVGEAGSGGEAVALSEKLNPDIIFMDIKMPGINGIEASKMIKEKDKNKVIIMLTAYDDFHLAQKAIKLKVDDYLLKPAKREEILDSLNTQINNLNKINPTNNYGINTDLKSKEIKTAVNYIEKNYNKEISFDEVSKMVNLSPSYFSKLFKKETGINFVSYVTNEKIKKAKELLEIIDIPILNISLDLGYKESNYFSRVFKKIEGISPTEYRNNILNK